MSEILKLKQSLADKLKMAGDKLDPRGKMMVAISMGISTKTIDRYTAGDLSEIRRVEFAEKMLVEIDCCLEIKTT